MGQTGQGAVGEFKDQQVFNRPPGAAQNHAAVRFGNAVKAGHQFLQQPGVPGHRPDGQGWRQITFAKGNRAIGTQAVNAGHRQSGITGHILAGGHKTGTQTRHLDLLGIGATPHRITGQHADPPEARARGFGMGRINAGASGLLERNGQGDQACLAIRPDRDGRWRRGIGGDGKRRAIGEQAVRRRNGDLPGIQPRFIQFQPGKAKALQRMRGKRAAHQRFGKAILLLEVLGSEEKPFRPDDLVRVRHACPLCAVRSSAL